MPDDYTRMDRFCRAYARTTGVVTFVIGAHLYAPEAASRRGSGPEKSGGLRGRS